MVQRNTWAEVSLGESVINISYFVGVDGIKPAAGTVDDLHHADRNPGILWQPHL